MFYFTCAFTVCKMSLLLLSFVTLFGMGYSDDEELKNLALKYQVSTNLETWFQAFINCRAAGLELASISSESDQKNLDKFLKQYGYDGGYWLSGSNLGNGSYTWMSTGKLVTFKRWLPNQPDNASLEENKFRGEHCIQWGLYNSGQNPTGWNDLFCGYKLPYICEEVEYCT